jgi:hypothetical protein
LSSRFADDFSTVASPLLNSPRTWLRHILAYLLSQLAPPLATGVTRTRSSSSSASATPPRCTSSWPARSDAPLLLLSFILASLSCRDAQ